MHSIDKTWEYLNGIFGIIKTFVDGAKKQVFQANTRGVFNSLQNYKQKVRLHQFRQYSKTTQV